MANSGVNGMAKDVPKTNGDSMSVAITGASSGIGRALALEFAKNHKNITLHLAGRNEARLQESKEQILSHNPAAQVLLQCFDVSDEEAVKQWCENIFQSRVDMVIMNAGVAMGEEQSAAKHSEICKTNALGVAFGSFYALESMNKQDFVYGSKGQIVLISSIAALLALPNAPSYSASKIFVRALGESISVGQSDVCVTTICPGFIRTPLTQFIHPLVPQMSVESAVKKMYNAIIKGKRFYAFPWWLAFGARFYNILPFWCKRAFVRMFHTMGSL